MSTEMVLPQPGYAVTRRFPRYKLNVPIRVYVQKKDRTAIIEARGNEINEGGMAVFAGTELSVGERIAVEFTPPYSGEPIRVRCQVANRLAYTYGVAFLVENAADEIRVEEIRSVLRGFGSRIPS